MKLFSLVKKLFKFPLITLNFPREETKHLLLLRRLKQKINAKPFKLLVQLMAHTISLQLQLAKVEMIIICENRDVPSVHKLSWWNNLQTTDIARDFPRSIHDAACCIYTCCTISESKEQWNIVRAKSKCKRASNRSNVTWRWGKSTTKMACKAIHI